MTDNCECGHQTLFTRTGRVLMKWGTQEGMYLAFRDAVTAPVPKEWKQAVSEMVDWWDDQHMTLAQGRSIRDKARALLQSAEVRHD